MKEIPISKAKEIAEKYGYEQVIILARVDSEEHEWCGHTTTYNKFKGKCGFLGQVGKILMNNFSFFYFNEEKTNEYCEKIDYKKAHQKKWHE